MIFEEEHLGGWIEVTKTMNKRKGRVRHVRHARTRIKMGDFFRHDGRRSVFLAVEPRLKEREDSDVNLDAIDVSNGGLFTTADDPARVFRKVFFEPAGKAMKISDMDPAFVFMTPTDMVIISNDGFYSIGGSRLKKVPKGKDRFPVMEIILDDPR